MHRRVVVLVGGVGPPADEDQIGRYAQLGQAGGERALPGGTDDGEVAALAADRARSRRVRHVVPGVDELHEPEAVAHLGNGQDDGALRQVEGGERVERIDVEADDRLVRGVGKLAVVRELIDRREGSLRLCDMRDGVDLRLDVDQRHAEDPGLLRKRAGLVRLHRRIHLGAG